MTAKKAQIEKFKRAARKLETDDNEKRFNERLGEIAKQIRLLGIFNAVGAK